MGYAKPKTALILKLPCRISSRILGRVYQVRDISFLKENEDAILEIERGSSNL